MARGKPTTDTRRDRRYGTVRWQKLRLRVLARDLYACWVAGCPRQGAVADHINPVYLGMPDADFYDPSNLRASCAFHNTARGIAARLEREAQGQFSPPPRPRWHTVKWTR